MIANKTRSWVFMGNAKYTNANELREPTKYSLVFSLQIRKNSLSKLLLVD